MKIVRFFLYLSYLELLLLAITAILTLKNSMELGAVVFGFIFLLLFIYYGLSCVVLHRYLVNGRTANVFVLLFFNILPILLLYYVLI